MKWTVPSKDLIGKEAIYHSVTREIKIKITGISDCHRYYYGTRIGKADIEIWPSFLVTPANRISSCKAKEPDKK